MERMIGDLLDLTRARLGGSIPLNRRPVDLQQVCEEAMIEIRASQPDAVLRLQVSGDLRGEWDADRLAQVVSNLVGNAIQHGGGTPITLTGAPQFPRMYCRSCLNRSLAAAWGARGGASASACSSHGPSYRHMAGASR
jgi:K+-sensing histidine kinase KdpD